MAGEHWSEAPLGEVTPRGVSLSPHFAGPHGNHISSGAKLFALCEGSWVSQSYLSQQVSRLATASDGWWRAVPKVWS